MERTRKAEDRIRESWQGENAVERIAKVKDRASKAVDRIAKMAIERHQGCCRLWSLY
ncbi:hypothetical protein I6G82_09330 [Lysinibacillus macroides]|nr:hypothetical protein [Lysinibacillus macroides]QPR69761.1 hypothetical protein I6G82_09330 [Lysinibacillus macroides]